MGSLTLLLGGARSGKSTLAVELGRRHEGPVVYVATAEALDDDMAGRIARHRVERPADWRTIEEPLDLAGALTAASAPDALVIVDCLTLWVSNAVLASWRDEDVEEMSASVAEAAAAGPANVVAVSNEVGLGLVPDNELGRRYRDLLGRVNQQWAAAADRTLLMVAGRALALTDPWELLPVRQDRDPT